MKPSQPFREIFFSRIDPPCLPDDDALGTDGPRWGRRRNCSRCWQLCAGPAAKCQSN